MRPPDARARLQSPVRFAEGLAGRGAADRGLVHGDGQTRTLGQLATREMGAAIIDPRRLKGHVLTKVERLFPEQLGIVEKRLRKHGK